MNAVFRKFIFIYWIDKDSHDSVCERLGLTRHLTLNGRTAVPTPVPKKLYDELVELEKWDILRMTLLP